MTLKVVGSGEIVQRVFWLDLRSRTVGVRLWHPDSGYQRCSERPIADILLTVAGGRITRVSVECVLGEWAEEILRDE